MHKSKLPAIRLDAKPSGLQFRAPQSALDRWDPTLVAMRAAAPEQGEISILGQIGPERMGGVSSGMVKTALEAIGSKVPLRVVLNSPGGDAIEGIAIYNLVAGHSAKVTMHVIGQASSAASVIAMAGDRIEMGEAALMMIHEGMGLVLGGADDMDEVAAFLRQLNGTVAELYANRSGQKVEDVLVMMKKETWMSAKDAVSKGFADVALVKDSKKKAYASAALAALKKSIFALNPEEVSLAASGDQRRFAVQMSATPPGASGTLKNVPKGTEMKTIAEQIASFEAKRQASAARMTDIMSAAADAGSTLDEAQTQEYDTLAAEVKAVDGHIVRLKAHEAAMISTATKIVPADMADPEKASAVRANSGIISVGPKLEKGIPFARYALSLARAHGNRAEALAQVQANRRWMDQTPEVAKVLMTAVPAADTTTAGWASELVYAENMQNEFIEYLRPMTILGRLPAVRKVPFNIRMGSLTGGTTGYWVGQGKAIPMSKGTTGSLTLGIAKAAGMAAYDDELLKSSSPSIELLVRNDLAKAVSQVIDIAFIDPNNGGLPNEKPASVLYGLTPITPSGVNAAAVAVDIAAVFAAAIAANLDPTTGVWVMTPTTALKLSLMLTSLGGAQYPGISINGGTWNGLPVIVSQNAYIAGSPQFGQMIVLVLQDEILVADDGGIDIQISNEASIEMLDNPTNLSTGATAPTTVVSMFQTQAWAIKAVKYLNFVKRRAAAAAFLQGVAYA